MELITKYIWAEVTNAFSCTSRLSCAFMASAEKSKRDRKRLLMNKLKVLWLSAITSNKRATSCSLLQRCPTECVSNCEWTRNLKNGRSKSKLGCCATEKKISYRPGMRNVEIIIFHHLFWMLSIIMVFTKRDASRAVCFQHEADRQTDRQTQS
jgi:hypothetical protein